VERVRDAPNDQGDAEHFKLDHDASDTAIMPEPLPLPPPMYLYAHRAPAGRQENSLAVMALVLGILGWLLPLLGPVALILGTKALNDAGNPAHPSYGERKGLALAGLILGGVVTGLMSLAIYIFLLS
jgi:hypothetical protein